MAKPKLPLCEVAADEVIHLSDLADRVKTCDAGLMREGEATRVKMHAAIALLTTELNAIVQKRYFSG